ncbi:sucrase ferredoxin [Motilibacter peucedani]|uniref:sucrase ferredoxin n=1 Tax=Motilibacter peucedani TaxID=598650 RepID=UPI0011C42E8B|nr:sucrase ferredoxin [Motilibacter peucedani]
MTTVPDRRCSTASRDSGEDVLGTAAPVRRWLLLERPGAWSQAALAETLAAVFSPDQRRRLHALARDEGLRTLLVRRPGRDTGTGPVLVHVGSAAAPGAPAWMERLEVPQLQDVGRVAVDRLLQPGLGEPVADPLLLVCTHGSKDMCCAVEGRPLARALAAVHGEQVWECSHVGGDRFAGNLVVAPHGEYYGRLEVADALRVGEAATRGEVLAETGFRGRSTYDGWQQVAEAVVRRREGLRGRGDVVCGPSRSLGLGAAVEVTTARATLTVRMLRRPGVTVTPSRCRGGLTSLDHQVVGVDVVPHPAW